MTSEGGVQGNPGLNRFQGQVLLEPFGQEQAFFCSRPGSVWQGILPCSPPDLVKGMEAVASVMSRWEQEYKEIKRRWF